MHSSHSKATYLILVHFALSKTLRSVLSCLTFTTASHAGMSKRWRIVVIDIGTELLLHQYEPVVKPWFFFHRRASEGQESSLTCGQQGLRRQLTQFFHMRWHIWKLAHSSVRVCQKLAFFCSGTLSIYRAYPDSGFSRRRERQVFFMLPWRLHLADKQCRP